MFLLVHFPYVLQVLKDEGVAHRIKIAEYPLCFIPYEQDLLSLEMPGIAEEVATASSRSLSLLESMFGFVPNVKAQGEVSKRILSNYMRSRREARDQGEVCVSHTLNSTICFVFESSN